MPAFSDPFDVFGYEDLLEQIRKLPSIYRDALYMVSVAGYSIKDAAALFGVSNQTLRKRLGEKSKLANEPSPVSPAVKAVRKSALAEAEDEGAEQVTFFGSKNRRKDNGKA